jgi:phage tail sheath protein FI
MAFQLSPGVLVTEEDRSTVIPSVATSAGAFAGAFKWGPVDQVTTVDSENTLVERFGRPNDTTSPYFFTAANFLSYGNNLQLVRTVDKAAAKNSVSSASGSVTGITVTSSPDTLDSATGFEVVISAPDEVGGVQAEGEAVLASTGSVENCYITNAGFGYSVVPQVTFSGGNGTGATAQAFLRFGRVVFIVVSASGNNYTQSSTIAISGGGGSGATANLRLSYSVPSATVDVAGDNYQGESASISVSNVTAGAVAPTFAPIVGYPVLSAEVTSAGNNYIDGNVTVTISGGGGTGANANVTLGVNGEVTAINILDAGFGYTSAPDVVINRNDEANVSISAEAGGSVTLDSNGIIKSVTVTNVGSGMLTAPVLTVNRNNANTGANAEITAVIGHGRVIGVTVTNQGNNYTSAPTITFNKNNELGGANAAAVARIEAELASVIVTNRGSGYTSAPAVQIVPQGGDNPGNGATVISELGFAIGSVNITEPGSGYTEVPTVSIVNQDLGLTANASAAITTQGILINNSDDYDSNFANGGLIYGRFAAKYPGELGNSIRVSTADSSTFDNWAYRAQFDDVPGTSDYARTKNANNDELHIVVIDETGDISGTAGSVVEKFAFLSKSSDARRADGSTNYYKQVVNEQSQYIWWLNHPAGSNWGTVATTGKTYDDQNTQFNSLLSGGVSGDSVSVANVMSGYEIFRNDELYDVSLMPMGPLTDVGAINTAIGIAESRRDLMVFASPPLNTVFNTVDSVNKIIEFRDDLTSSSFGVIDTGWKYQYDRYNDTYRYIPLNGDIAGLAARTDYIADPWFSPAGYNRGVIKNVVKIPYSPGKTDRDLLYKKGINPVVTFPGQGTVLFGDKTMQARPSAFDRINVRRLFIVLEKAIATASKFQLFEFNDAFTRAQFRNLVEPFLRDVQGRRGITDFRVICDETNNTGEVIDRNEFVADIFVKPARAINFIQLNFVATRSNVSFQEVGA